MGKGKRVVLLKAGELGCALAYYNLGNNYSNGNGVTIDKKKAKHYLELAAMNGNVMARYNLACAESRADNNHLAFKLFMLAARAGDKLSLDTVKQGYMGGIVTKDEYSNTLREYQKSQDEMKSDARDKALAARNARPPNKRYLNTQHFGKHNYWAKYHITALVGRYRRVRCSRTLSNGASGGGGSSNSAASYNSAARFLQAFLC